MYLGTGTLVSLYARLWVPWGETKWGPEGYHPAAAPGRAEIECEDEAGGEVKEVDCLALLPKCRTYT